MPHLFARNVTLILRSTWSHVFPHKMGNKLPKYSPKTSFFHFHSVTNWFLLSFSPVWYAGCNVFYTHHKWSCIIFTRAYLTDSPHDCLFMLGTKYGLNPLATEFIWTNIKLLKLTALNVCEWETICFSNGVVFAKKRRILQKWANLTLTSLHMVFSAGLVSYL